MLNSNTIGDKIATARKSIFLSQADLAQKISISPQAVGKWERGESMPDITTLNRLAEILGVDLNYFSESFQSLSVSNPTHDSVNTEISGTAKSPVNTNRDMSKLNLADSDFSGLKNLSQNFSSANMQRCLFIGSNLSGLILNKNNVDGCDFSDSDISKSQIQGSNLQKNKFNNCSLNETVITKSNILQCDFSGANFTGTVFTTGNFMKSTLENIQWNLTSFIEMQLQDITFTGTFNECTFENCGFYTAKFENATFINTFFKNNRKFKRVKFINCKVDKITYAFLKNNLADLKGVVVME